MRTNQKLWDEIVNRLKNQPDGWSARKAQQAVLEYKKKGGGYTNPKSKNNSLVKWTNEKWDYVNKNDAKKPFNQRGRYLPEKVRNKLTPSQKASTNKIKRDSSKKGVKYAPYSKQIISMFK